MKSLYVIVVLLISPVLALVGATRDDSLMVKKVEAITEVVKKQYAPDKRTALFNTEFPSLNPLTVKVETTDKKALTLFKSLLEKDKIQASIEDEVLPSADLEGRVYGVANLSVCNNRLTPANSAEMVSQTLLGTPVEILKRERGYYLVRTPDRYISWVDDSGIAAMDMDVFNRWKRANKIVFTADYGHSYNQPGADALRVSDLVAGNILELKGSENGFYKVAYPDGRTAYVAKSQATLFNEWVSRPNPDAAKILNTAKTLLGVPYLWGGTSVKGVDCSGFTKTSYYLNGIILARDASQQALTGEKVDIYDSDTVSIAKCLSNLKAGDLLFFAGGLTRGGNPRVTHTAIYIGNGEFIQSAGMVKISSLLKNAPNYDGGHSRGLVSARRVLTAIGTDGVSRIDHHDLYKTELK